MLLKTQKKYSVGILSLSLHISFFADTMSFEWASLVAQLVKSLPAVWETWAQSLGWEDPVEKGAAIYSSSLTWRSLWSV